MKNYTLIKALLEKNNIKVNSIILKKGGVL